MTLRHPGQLVAALAVAALGATSARSARAQEENTPPPEAVQPAPSEAPPPQAYPPPPPEGTMTPPEAPAPPPVAAAPPPPPERRHNRIFAPSEISLTTGAGVTDYFGTGTGLTGRTDPGAAWDARVTFGTHSVFALEAGYLGAVNSIDVPAGKGGHVNSNGLDGDLRVQLPTRVQPYIFAGVGWNFMNIDNGNANPSITSELRGSDNQLTVPAGGGVTGYIGRHATVDLRGTYRYIPENDISILNTRALHQWMAQARVGYAF